MHTKNKLFIISILLTFLTSAQAASKLPKLKKSIDIDSRITTVKTPTKMEGDKKENFIYIESSKFIFKTNAKGPKALDVLRSSCLKKKAESCFVLGQYVQEKDSVEASVPFYKRSCDLKEEKACLVLGSHLQFKLNKKKEALKAWEFPCQKKKNIIACFHKAQVLKDLGKTDLALKEFQAQCNFEHRESCMELAYLLREKSIKDKNLKLLEAPLLIFSRFCIKGDKPACGQAADTAYSLKKMDLAEKFYKIDCDNGTKLSCGLHEEIKKSNSTKN